MVDAEELHHPLGVVDVCVCEEPEFCAGVGVAQGGQEVGEMRGGPDDGFEREGVVDQPVVFHDVDRMVPDETGEGEPVLRVVVPVELSSVFFREFCVCAGG